MSMDINHKKPILVIGVGNIVQQDDGVGVHAIEAMRQWDDLPESVELFDGGTAGVDLTGVIEHRDTVIVIDAVDADHAPGTFFRFTPDDVTYRMNKNTSLHQLGLIETMNMAVMQGIAPRRSIVFGVQPHVIDWGTELTETVRGKLPRLLELVREEIDAAVEDYETNRAS